MLRFHDYLRKSAYEEGEEEEPTVLLDSAAARLVKIFQTCSTQSIPLIVYTIGAQSHNVKCAYLGTFLTTKQGSMSGALLMNQLLTKTIKLSV